MSDKTLILKIQDSWHFGKALHLFRTFAVSYAWHRH